MAMRVPLMSEWSPWQIKLGEVARAQECGHFDWAEIQPNVMKKLHLFRAEEYAVVSGA